MRYDKPSRLANRDRRWPALRLRALRRDDWKCVKCGSKRHLQVDHIQPVRTHPGLAFDLGNLQVLCGTCHAIKTRQELGYSVITPDRRAWLDLMRKT